MSPSGSVPGPQEQGDRKTLSLQNSLLVHPGNVEVSKPSDVKGSEWHKGGASEIMASLPKERSHQKQLALPAMKERAEAMRI